MSARTIAVCDVCGAQLELKTSGPLNDSEYCREIGMEGWTQRADAFRDVCPKHPRSVA